MFWELNVPDVEERTKLKILKGLTYHQQAEARARDFSDFLADSESFPRILGLGLAQKRVQLELLSLVPKKGQVLKRLGGLITETSDLRKALSAGGLTQDQPTGPLQGQGASGKWSPLCDQ